MSANNFNIGSDAKITWLSDGAPIRSSILTEFSAKQETAKLKSNAIDGVVRNRHVEQGWSGMLKFDRTDSFIDDYFAAKEIARYAGLPPPVVNILQTVISAADGSVARYRYDGVAMTLDDAGSYAGDKKVDQSVSFDASYRVKVA